jgi:hypothetical protein
MILQYQKLFNIYMCVVNIVDGHHSFCLRLAIVIVTCSITYEIIRERADYCDGDLFKNCFGSLNFRVLSEPKMVIITTVCREL